MIPHRWQPLLMLIASRFREFIREPEVIFWVYGFPLVLAVGLSIAFQSRPPIPPDIDVAQDSPDPKRRDEVVKQLADERWKGENPIVKVLPIDECKARLKKGTTAVYLIVHAKEIEYRYDEARTDSVQARYWVEAILSRHRAELTAINRPIDEKGSRYIDFLLPALIALNTMGGGLFGVGFVLVDMRVRKLFKRLMATPMRHSDFLLSLVISRLLFLIPEMASLLLVGYWWFELPPLSLASIFALVLTILIGASAFAGIGLLIGSRTDKTETASGLINAFMLPQYILSGVFFKSTNFPDVAQPFIQALPLTQMIDALREVMLYGANVLDVSWRLGILLMYAVVPFAIALRWFKWR